MNRLYRHRVATEAWIRLPLTRQPMELRHESASAKNVALLERRTPVKTAHTTTFRKAQ